MFTRTAALLICGIALGVPAARSLAADQTPDTEAGQSPGAKRAGTVVYASDPARLARVRAAKMPEITHPVSFDTPEGDAIAAALEVFPPDNPWNAVVTDWPVHPNSQNLVAAVGVNKTMRYNRDMAYIFVPPDQKRSQAKGWPSVP